MPSAAPPHPTWHISAHVLPLSTLALSLHEQHVSFPSPSLPFSFRKAGWRSRIEALRLDMPEDPRLGISCLPPSRSYPVSESQFYSFFPLFFFLLFFPLLLFKRQSLMCPRLTLKSLAEDNLELLILPLHLLNVGITGLHYNAWFSGAGIDTGALCML